MLRWCGDPSAHAASYSSRSLRGVAAVNLLRHAVVNERGKRVHVKLRRGFCVCEFDAESAALLDAHHGVHSARLADGHGVGRESGGERVSRSHFDDDVDVIVVPRGRGRE